MKESDGQQLLNITHATNNTNIIGAEATGDDLTLKANTTDTYCNMILEGGAGDIIFNSGDDVKWAKNGTQYGLLYGDANEMILYPIPANADIYLRTDAAGYVKFGTYAAITTETLQGYITIKDAANNSRKIGVVA